MHVNMLMGCSLVLRDIIFLNTTFRIKFLLFTDI